jgi:prepilin peptidase CpaA
LARPSDFIVLATIVGAALVAAAIDLRTRRVPNALNLLLAALGLVLAATGVSGVSAGAAAAGCALGLALMLPGFLFGATGAGDVKLFAAMGTLVGPAHIGRAFVFTAIAGGLMALAIAASRGRLQLTLGRTARLVSSAGANAPAIEAPVENNRFPYAPAIAVGCVIAALGL